MRKAEVYLYNFFAKRQIDRHQVIHFFFHSLPLVQYAKSRNKIILVESFTHFQYIEKIYGHGIQLDTDELIPDHYSAHSYQFSDKIISPSEWVSETLRDAGLGSDRIELIPYGVNAQEDREYIPQEPLRLMFAGGLKRTKGVVELLKAVKAFDSTHIQLSLFGRPYANTKTAIQSIDVNSQMVRFRGFSHSLIEEYKNHDIYVYPTYFEGSSKTVFEAMSCGLPVITTENAGSIVRDGIDGFIVPFHNIGSLTEKIQYFLDNPEEVQKMGVAAQRYSREYTWERYAREVNRVYQEL